jgi:hypothetical protein
MDDDINYYRCVICGNEVIEKPSTVMKREKVCFDCLREYVWEVEIDGNK